MQNLAINIDQEIMFCCDKKKTTNSKRELRGLATEIEERSQLYHIGSDPTRLKILFLLKSNKELCVTDLAEILEMTVSAVSHQLALLERSGLVCKVKKGKIVCYSLKDKSKKVFCWQ